MANAVIGKIEVVLEDVFSFLKKTQQVVLKGPTVILALSNLFTAVEKVVTDVSGDVANPTGLINIQMDINQFNDLKAVWADIKAAFAAIGIKI